MKKLLIALSVLVSASLFAAEAAKAPAANQLPRVLIIGDSISLGYTPFVTQMLKAEAVVVHNKGNAQHTGTGLKQLDQWLGTSRWDVIHFNWGLWDLAYRGKDAAGKPVLDKTKGTLTTPLPKYEQNLEQLVTRLEKTKATLLWANTTVVPEQEPGRFVGDDKKYNEAAARVMQKHGIATDDLYGLTQGFPAELFLKPGNVHYTKEGYQKLAEQVAGKIRKALGARQAK